MLSYPQQDVNVKILRKIFALCNGHARIKELLGIFIDALKNIDIGKMVASFSEMMKLINTCVRVILI